MGSVVSGDAATEPGRTDDVWVIQGGDKERLVDRFVDEGVIGIDEPAVPDAEILTRTEIRRFLVEGGTTKAIDDHAAVVSAFVNELREGDSVLMPDTRRDEVVIGQVSSRYQFHDDVAPDLCRHRRTVTWLARHDIAALPTSLRGTLKQKHALVQDRSAEWSGHIAAVKAGEVGRDPSDRGAIRRPAATSTPRRAAAPKPRAPKPAPVAEQTCPSCHMRKPARLFDGELCVDCA